MNNAILFSFVIVVIGLFLYLLTVIMCRRLCSLFFYRNSGLLCCKATHVVDIESQEYEHYCDCCYTTYGWNDGYNCCC